VGLTTESATESSLEIAQVVAIAAAETGKEMVFLDIGPTLLLHLHNPINLTAQLMRGPLNVAAHRKANAVETVAFGAVETLQKVIRRAVVPATPESFPTNS